MANPHAFIAPQNRPAPILPQVASVECRCGAMHHSADGRVPVGWTVSRGEAFCTDCTRTGIPTRLITAPVMDHRKAPNRNQLVSLLVEGQALMPAGSKKRADWVHRVNALLNSEVQVAA